jgi:chorismate synthase
LEIGGVRASAFDPAEIERNPVRCADAEAARLMVDRITAAKEAGDSVGGVVEVRAEGVPPGWGDPVFGKLDAMIACGLMGIGAVKGVEIGDGFAAARATGSENNDQSTPDGYLSNHAGGILGGISTGQTIVARAAVKPTPSIGLPQRTVTTAGEPAEIRLAGRHDPCICPRLVPVAEAMVLIVLADAMLIQATVDSSRCDGVSVPGAPFGSPEKGLRSRGKVVK